MKKTRRLLCLALVLVMCLSLLPIGAAAAGNSITSATAIKAGKSYTGKLSESNTADFYKLTLTSAGRLTFNGLNELRWVYYYLYDGNGNQMWSANPISNGSTGVNQKSETWDLTKGVYYFAVAKDGSNYGSYTFDFSFTSAKESIAEAQGGDNNTLGSADIISLNQQYTGQLADNDEKDFYKFTMKSKGSVTITATTGMRWVYYYIYDASGNEKFKKNPLSNSSTGVNQISETVELAKGTYYFVVARDGGNTGPYKFKLASKTAPTPSSGGSGTTTTEGWKQVGSYWRYRNADGSYVKNAWKKISGKWYFFDSSGNALTGWQKISRKWYYFNKSGAMQTGWQKISGTWYFFDSSGVMQTGWQKIGGSWYFFDSSGGMQTGWTKISGKWYYFDGSGAMQTGWQKISGEWYYFNSSGVWTK